MYSHLDDHYTKIKEERRQLPICAARSKIINQVQQNDSVIIISETGSGKTTQIPQYLLEAGIHKHCIIAITQVQDILSSKSLYTGNRNLC